jgi:hypothetical protein
MIDDTCKDHSSCMTRIKRSEQDIQELWDILTGIRNKQTAILTGVVISCVLLVINLISNGLIR